MAINDARDAHKTTDIIERELGTFLFGIPHAIKLSVRAIITVVPYDANRRKEVGPAHILFDDPPGRGKTALVLGLASILEAKATLVEGTPDRMPNEFTGYEMFMRGTDAPFWVEGKLATNFLLCDEINRMPSKTQSALLGAMEGRIVTESHVDLAARAIRTKVKQLYPVPDDDRYFFMVMATQNPIEQEGTFSLPEAQRDRFTYGASIGRPKREDEMRIRAANVVSAAIIDESGKTVRSAAKRIEATVPLKDIVDIGQFTLENIPLTDEASEYMMRLIENSNPGLDSRLRTTKGTLLRTVDDHVLEGMSPRSNFHLEAAARAQAFMCEADVIAPEHVRDVAPIVMAHRLILRPSAIAHGITGRRLTKEIVDNTRLEL